MWSLSRAVLNHKMSAECNKFISPLFTSNKLPKNNQKCFFGSTGAVIADAGIAPRNISIEDKISFRQVSTTPRNRDER